MITSGTFKKYYREQGRLAIHEYSQAIYYEYSQFLSQKKSSFRFRLLQLLHAAISIEIKGVEWT